MKQTLTLVAFGHDNVQAISDGETVTVTTQRERQQAPAVSTP